MAVKQGPSHGLHLIATIFTAGLWLPIWLLLGIISMFGAFRCARCGLGV